MKRRIGITWVCIGLLLLLGALFWIWILPYRYTAFLFWAVGGVWLIYRLLSRLGKNHPRASRGLQAAFTACLILVVLAFGILEGLIVSGSRGAEDPACPYVLVLGAGVNGSEPSRALLQRLEAAYAYLQSYPEAQCIVSGGMGAGEEISEAQCMFNWLTRQGIAPERIWMEDKATSTMENLRFTLELVEEKTGLRPDALAVVSNEFHLYRASLMARSLDITMLGVPAATHPLPLRLHYYFRETFGILYFLLLGR